MASDFETVKLSHKQLVNLSRRYGSNENEQKQTGSEEAKKNDNKGRRAKKTEKRPDKQIYRPGKTRLSKRSASECTEEDDNLMSAVDAEGVIRDLDDDAEAQEAASNKEDTDANRKARRRQRRPAMPLYVPKHRLQDGGGDEAAEAGPGANDEEESISGDAQSDPCGADDPRTRGANRDMVVSPTQHGGNWNAEPADQIMKTADCSPGIGQRRDQRNAGQTQKEREVTQSPLQQRRDTTAQQRHMTSPGPSQHRDHMTTSPAPRTRRAHMTSPGPGQRRPVMTSPVPTRRGDHVTSPGPPQRRNNLNSPGPTKKKDDFSSQEWEKLTASGPEQRRDNTNSQCQPQRGDNITSSGQAQRRGNWTSPGQVRRRDNLSSPSPSRRKNSLTSPGSVRRKVDVKPGVHNMVVTLVNPDNSSGAKHRQRDPLPRGGPPDQEAVEMSSKPRGKRDNQKDAGKPAHVDKDARDIPSSGQVRYSKTTDRGPQQREPPALQEREPPTFQDKNTASGPRNQHLSIAADFLNLSKESEESLDWDCQVEMEAARHERIGFIPEYIPEDIGAIPDDIRFDDDEELPSLLDEDRQKREQHADGKGRRNNLRSRHRKKPPPAKDAKSDPGQNSPAAEDGDRGSHNTQGKAASIQSTGADGKGIARLLDLKFLSQKPDEKVQESISQGTFQGLVITNSKFDQQQKVEDNVRGKVDNRDSAKAAKNGRGKDRGQGGNRHPPQKSDWRRDPEERVNHLPPHPGQRRGRVRHGSEDKSDTSDGYGVGKDTSHASRKGHRRHHSSDSTERRGGACEDRDQSRKMHQLKVTFAENERLVKLDSNASAGSSEERELGYHHGGRDTSPPHTAKGGGIIRLPPQTTSVKTHDDALSNRHDHPEHYHPPPPQSQRGPRPRGRGQGHGQGRGGGHRSLYDPNNPTKPIQISGSPKALHFQDSGDQSSPDQYPGYGGEQPAAYRGVTPNMTPPSAQYYQMAYRDMPRGDARQAPPDANYYNNYRAQYYEAGVYSDTAMRDPYYNYSGYENESGLGQSADRVKAEGLLHDVLLLERQLGTVLSRGIHGKESLQKAMTLRHEVQCKHAEIVLLEPDLANKHNVEQMLWKTAFYQVIELLRKQLAEGEADWLREAQLHLLDEGTTFFEGLLKSLQSTFAFQLEEFLDSHQLPPENVSRRVKLGLLSAQRSMIALGDIARYREQTNHTSNFGKARNWYTKAQQIAPKNGRPYNQLAILALYTRRKLDAVYYYMRSLAASNPFLTARESLMQLFDDARKKAEVTEKKKLLEQAATRRRRQQNRRHTSSEQGHRVEVWVAPDGSTQQDQVEDSDEEGELQALSAVELNKRFVLSFLNVQGKLFTKIGMETFPELSSQMLHELRVLLQHTPSPIGNVRLLQLMTINMFAVDNTVPRDTPMEEDCRSLVQEQAIQLGLDVFGLIANRCTALFREHLASGDCQVLSEDLHQLFPSVKVWSDWMVVHANLWNPPPMPRDPELGPNIDVWRSAAELSNMLRELDISHVKIYTQKKEGCDPIILPEDMMLAGFVPLLSLPHIPSYVHSLVDKEIARDCLRVEKLRTFADYLCGIEPPLLAYDVENRQYVSIAPEVDEGVESSHDRSYESQSSKDDDVLVESDSDEDTFQDSSEEEHIRRLKAKKGELERAFAEKQRQQESRCAVIESSYQQNRPIALEICPLFLVPDTNCFIDHLAGLDALLTSKKFTFIVPLVVINELDGLAKGSRDDQYETVDHADMVRFESQKAVHYLEDQFDSRNSHLRALTSKGSVMDTISFRVEESSSEGTNDDLILSCCLHYCKDKARDFMPRDRDEPIRLHREVVLLTDDRNLRLKAHMRNVPVKDIPSFLRWAKIS